MAALEDALTLALAFGPKAGLRPYGAPALLDPAYPLEAWFALDDAGLASLGVAPAQRARLLSEHTRETARAILDATGEEAWLWRGHPSWPAVFAELPDPPFVLAHRGRLEILEVPGVAVVGPRAASSYGMHAARGYASALALAGVCITSGLARGIDAIAHEAALAAAAPTIAILGGSLDRIYPPEHEALVSEIVEHGGIVLSEAPPGTEARPALFPRRNRLLVALSRALLVVEATQRSGALLSAEWALAYDRPIFAVPGPWSSPQSEGCHRLIRDGATLADSPSSLIADLGLQKGEEEPLRSVLQADQVAVLEALRRRPHPVDALAAELRLTRARVLVVLRELEIAGRVEREAGASYRLALTRRT